MFKTALKMLYSERKKSLNFLFSITTTLCISLIFLQFQTNPHISSKISFLDIFLQNENYLLAWLAFGVMLICFALMGYSCNYYMRVHSREYGLLRLCGYSFFKILLYQMTQITVIMIISFIITILLSFIYIPIFLYIIYHYTNMNYSIFIYPVPALTMSCTIVIPLMLIIILFMQCRYIQSHSISDLLKQNHLTEYNEDNNTFHIPDAIYLFAYLLGLLTMYLDNEFSIGFVFAACIGIYGAYGIFYYWIPHTIAEALDNLNIKANHCIVFGNLSLFVQQSKTLIIFIMLSVILLPTFILASIEKNLLHISLHITIVLINSLLSLSLINRYNLDLFEKKQQYHNLFCIGLEKHEIFHIAQKEVLFFYIILFISTIIYLIGIFSVFYFNAIIDPLLYFVIFLEYLLPYFMSFIYTYTQRRNFSCHS